MSHAKSVISIQSQVVHGHVGNSAAVFPMLAVGMEVAPIPTVLLSNTPNYSTVRGRSLPADLFADLLQGVRERGLPERADFIITGYIGSVEVAELTADFIAEAKAQNPRLTYICDPVMGDTGPGLYVPQAIAAIFRDRLLPMADLATPNLFEVEYLTGQPIASLQALGKAGQGLRLAEAARLIATGCVLEDTAPGFLETVILSADGLSRHAAPQLPVATSGTGDLFAGLLTAGLGGDMALRDAVEFAQRLTGLALARAAQLGTREVVLSGADFRRALFNAGATA